MTILRNFWLISPSVTINFSKMTTNPSHQTDSRRAAKDVDICYITVLILNKCTLCPGVIRPPVIIPTMLMTRGYFLDKFDPWMKLKENCFITEKTNVQEF